MAAAAITPVRLRTTTSVGDGIAVFDLVVRRVSARFPRSPGAPGSSGALPHEDPLLPPRDHTSADP
ncbi:hypothetical protein GCM10009755_13380 [Brevibacterium samyangense]|uniref:Uncharacterized protein n=1 Tax=Brevibacterium samyangense TaxID=366888 RepID=A0ABP5ESL9_9MICO